MLHIGKTLRYTVIEYEKLRIRYLRIYNVFENQIQHFLFDIISSPNHILTT